MTSIPAVHAALAALTLVMAWTGASVQAAPSPPSLLDASIYAPPAGWLDQPHGKLLKTSPVLRPGQADNTANAVLSALAAKAHYTKAVRAWRVAYTTTGADPELRPTVPGSPSLATGIIIAPVDAPWSATASRPVIVFAPKTQGLGSHCAPSKALELGTEETSEVARMAAALDQGYLLAITDYDGYTDHSQAHRYLVGQSLGHAVLDMALAVKQAIPIIDADDLPDAAGNKLIKVNPGSPMVIWGYSEGGTAAAWAGQQLPSYAPSLLSEIKAIATGGMVADSKVATQALDWSPASGLMIAGVWGFHVAYPQSYAAGGLYFDLNSIFWKEMLGDDFVRKRLLNPPATDTPGTFLHPDECVDQSVSHNMFKTMAFRNQGGYRVSQLISDTPTRQLHWDRVLQVNQVGNMKIPVPTFYYHGSIATSLRSDGMARDGDVILPATNFNEVFKRMCASGTKLWRKVYLSKHYLELNHETVSDRAFGDVLAWLGERIDQVPDTATCN